MRGNNILIINGPNINCLEDRENIYPNSFTYEQMCELIVNKYPQVQFFQSNCEGEIISKIQSVRNDENIGGLIINPGGYTHYSVSILDALKLLNIPKIEVHMSDITKRESFRNTSITSYGVDEVIMGKGIDSYILAIEKIIK